MTAMAHMTHITLACDHEQAEEFAAWLNRGLYTSAVVGSYTRTWVNGVDTSTPEGSQTPEARLLEKLWYHYCDSECGREART